KPQNPSCFILIKVMSKFQDHFGWLFDLVPTIDSYAGFFFYSFLAYMSVLFLGWLMNPTVDRLYEQKLESDKKLGKVRAMRAKNM
ncbi:MAG: hypothetical protein ACKO96_26775, partial [Flammeovirgaceae bacterium]